MRRHFLLFLTFLLAFSLVPTSASAAAPISAKFKGANAYANIFVTDAADPCIKTSVTVSGMEEAIKEGSGKPAKSSMLYVSVFRFRDPNAGDCGPVPVVLLDFFNFVQIPDDALKINQLQSATLVTSVDICDFQGGNCVPFSINLTWQGTGDVSKSKSKYSETLGKCKFHSSNSGSTRLAQVSGSVTMEGQTFVPQATDFGALNDSQSGSITINCE